MGKVFIKNEWHICVKVTELRNKKYWRISFIEDSFNYTPKACTLTKLIRGLRVSLVSLCGKKSKYIISSD